MLTKVGFYSDPQNATPAVECDLENTSVNDPIVLESISGLSSTEATLFTGDFARDGGYYQGRRIGKRNVVFNFLLREDYAADYTVADIREKMYRLFHQGKGDAVHVRLHDDRPARSVRRFNCYVERIEGDMFVKGNKLQVSAIMLDPFIEGTQYLYNNATGTNLMSMTYDGTAPVGFLTRIKIIGGNDHLRLRLNGKDFTLINPIFGGFKLNDIITIDSRRGFRQVLLNNVSIAGMRTPASQWQYLDPGDAGSNAFQLVNSTGGLHTGGRITYIEAMNMYWGI